MEEIAGVPGREGRRRRYDVAAEADGAGLPEREVVRDGDILEVHAPIEVFVRLEVLV